MSTALHRPLPADPLFASVLSELERLGRSHLLAYNLACGQLLLERFWGGDAAAFSNKDPGKTQTFGRFVTECADLLSDLGQSSDQLKRAVHAHLVWRGLPASTRDRLLLSHLVELGRCADPTTRAQLALATTTEQWTSATEQRQKCPVQRRGIPRRRRADDSTFAAKQPANVTATKYSNVNSGSLSSYAKVVNPPGGGFLITKAEIASSWLPVCSPARHASYALRTRLGQRLAMRYTSLSKSISLIGTGTSTDYLRAWK